ncbi:NRDE family protein [Allonocardiopsis opalescens]|uniref:Transport and Golgi organization protein 2 n=1 Tax=Allonocardiopsis opalescens TaxID=1144618 RepID=A0A2T0Q434_9ACTN|nr:NRDE family protein [Allonocardiopsis opalescens]PRX98560.1 transport and Golgi organization protein 2 [Allonocardiopsis opalescens]
MRAAREPLCEGWAVCTVVVDFRPGDEVPVLLAGVRDEFTGRPWSGPGRHWPDRPGLVGGRDDLAGGTWLAVRADRARVAAVLNGRLSPRREEGRRPVLDGRPAGGPPRRSRGELPLAAAMAGKLELGPPELAAFDPFHLVCAEPSGVRMWSWDGRSLVESELPEGVTVVVNTGLDALEPRAARFAPRFAAARRPRPAAGGGGTAESWGEWRALADGDGLGVSDPATIVTRVELPDGAVWASTSTTLVALPAGPAARPRYDFSDRPGDPARWREIAV